MSGGYADVADPAKNSADNNLQQNGWANLAMACILLW
jgi:hypothetical protein